MSIDLTKLSAPFPPEKVDWRVGPTTQDKTKGMALAYIDARDVMERLDDVCGPENWQCRYSHATTKTICEIGINLGEWIWKADGAGDTDKEAEKGAISSAFKRAAVKWGIGRYLYDVNTPWVAIEQRGKSYVIKDSELPKLAGVLGARSSTGGASVSKTKGGGSSPPAPATNGKKPPVPLWERASYEIPFKGNWQDWDGTLHRAIGKAPNFDALTKLQKDNADTLIDYSIANSAGHANLIGAFNREGGNLSQGDKA